MTFTTGFQRSLEEFAKRRPDKFRVVAVCDRSITATIKLGVLFIMSNWSGPSHIALPGLLKVLERVDPAAKLELVIVDNDHIGDLANLPDLEGKLHGYGETAWIRDGQVVSTTGKCDDTTEFERHARQLLEMNL